jgi:NADH:ubiquinone oxidoreductase subunit 4 (subunit M)
MTDWPLLSVVTFLPLIGALFHLPIRGDDRDRPSATSVTALLGRPRPS